MKPYHTAIIVDVNALLKWLQGDCYRNMYVANHNQLGYDTQGIIAVLLWL